MKVNPRRPPGPINHQRLKGFAIIGGTWTCVLTAMYLIIAGIVNDPRPHSYVEYEKQTGWPITSYQILFFTVVPTIFWLWALIAWIGMKFFRNG